MPEPVWLVSLQLSVAIVGKLIEPVPEAAVDWRDLGPTGHRQAPDSN
jgi:hypothetical protein